MLAALAPWQGGLNELAIWNLAGCPSVVKKPLLHPMHRMNREHASLAAARGPAHSRTPGPCFPCCSIAGVHPVQPRALWRAGQPARQARGHRCVVQAALSLCLICDVPPVSLACVHNGASASAWVADQVCGALQAGLVGTAPSALCAQTCIAVLSYGTACRRGPGARDLRAAGQDVQLRHRCVW